MKDKILFTTAYLSRERYDFYGYHTPGDLKISVTNPRVMHPGLRFIKQNLPQIEILEFPSWEEFTQIVSRGWDIVGFSFFTFETNEILQMADYARKAGVRVLWAGSYGAINPYIESTFDKVFTGYSEDTLAQEMGTEIGELRHPPLIDSYGLKPFGGPFVLTGWLYTARGCPMKCTFCQTPVFAPKIVKTPIDSIERVLRYYKEYGVQFIFIFDENFGVVPKHTRKVVSLLGNYNIPWGAMTRADVLKKSFDEWYENGFLGAMIGIESMNPDTLKDIQKRETIETTIEALELLNRHNCFAVGTYMIGFEQDTVDSVKQDFQQLHKLKPDFMKIYVIMPLIQTPLWDQIQQNYGIDTSDWSKFDGKHLVWNHPRLSCEDLQGLLEYGATLFNSEEYVLKLISKRIHWMKDQGGLSSVHEFFLSSIRNRLHGSIGSPYFFE